MKKLVFISFFVIFISFLFSCTNQRPTQKKVTTKVTTEKVVYSEGGFYVEQQTIINGNTVWGISEKIYGSGLQWRDILTLNPFLNTTDRLYYNPDRKMWIVRIYPGEVLNIGGQKVYPSCTYESTTTTTTTEPVPDPKSETVSASVIPVIPWWGWLSILAVIALIVWLFYYYRPTNSNSNSSSSSNSNVRVDIQHGNDIDADLVLAERVRMIQRQQYLQEDIWYDSYDILRKSAKNNRLKSFTVAKGEILVNASFRRDRRAERNDRREEEK